MSLLADQFATADPAPLVTPRTAEPGPGTWALTDPIGALSVVDGMLLIHEATDNPTWRTALWGGAITPSDFGALALTVRRMGVTQAGPAIVLSPDTACVPDSDADTHGFYFDTHELRAAGGTNLIHDATYLGRLRSIDYRFVLLRPASGGLLVFVSGGKQYPAGPDAKLVYVRGFDAIAAALYPGLIQASGSARIDDVEVLSQASLPTDLRGEYPAATVGDNFDRADGDLAGSTTPKGARVWMLVRGTPEVSGNRVIGTTAGQINEAYVDVGAVPRVIQATFTTPASVSGLELGITFRHGGGQWMYAYLSPSLIAILDGGGGGNIAQTGAVTMQPNTKYDLVVTDNGTDVAVWLNGYHILDATTTSRNTGTYAGFYLYGTGLTCERFTVHTSQTLTMPGGLAAPVRAPAGSAVPLLTDAFTSPDGTALTSHNPAWSTPQGTWEVRSGRARMTTPAVEGAAVFDAGTADHEVEAKITLTTASSESFGGLVARWSDAANCLKARYLYQDNSTEIEVWQWVDGVASLAGMVNLGPNTADPNTTHTMKLGASGVDFAVWHDGELVIQATTPLAGPHCGIGTHISGASGQPQFDDVVIKLTTDAAPPALVQAGQVGIGDEAVGSLVIGDAIPG